MEVIKTFLKILAVMPLLALITTVVVFFSTWGIAAILSLLVFFIIVINYRDWLLDSGDRQENLFFKVSFYTLGYTFLFADALFNYTIGVMLFHSIGWPRHVFTDRLKYELTHSEIGSWKHNLAWWMCLYLIEPFDPKHCGIKT